MASLTRTRYVSPEDMRYLLDMIVTLKHLGVPSLPNVYVKQSNQSTLNERIDLNSACG